MKQRKTVFSYWYHPLNVFVFYFMRMGKSDCNVQKLSFLSEIILVRCYILFPYKWISKTGWVNRDPQINHRCTSLKNEGLPNFFLFKGQYRKKSWCGRRFVLFWVGLVCEAAMGLGSKWRVVNNDNDNNIYLINIK